VYRVDWKGCGTALVTPFDDKGRIDFRALTKLVEWQIEQGIDFLVPCGTTGESATLSGEERKGVTAAVVKAAAGRVPVIAGAGGNHTAKAVFWARDAVDAGADGILSVSPMYNRPSPDGLVRHFSAIAEAADVPVIVYNIPARTGRDLGAGGLLGSELMKLLPDSAGLTHSQLSVTDLPAINGSLPRYRAEVVFNCAAFNAVDGAESQQEAAYQVNAQGAFNVALACAQHGARLVHAYALNDSEAAVLHTGGFTEVPGFSVRVVRAN